jgi:hypothetical protein
LLGHESLEPPASHEAAEVQVVAAAGSALNGMDKRVGDFSQATYGLHIVDDQELAVWSEDPSGLGQKLAPGGWLLLMKGKGQHGTGKGCVGE